MSEGQHLEAVKLKLKGQRTLHRCDGPLRIPRTRRVPVQRTSSGVSLAASMMATSPPDGVQDGGERIRAWATHQAAARLAQSSAREQQDAPSIRRPCRWMWPFDTAPETAASDPHPRLELSVSQFTSVSEPQPQTQPQPICGRDPCRTKPGNSLGGEHIGA